MVDVNVNVHEILRRNAPLDDKWYYLLLYYDKYYIFYLKIIFTITCAPTC
jgi:hypothetical protein